MTETAFLRAAAAQPDDDTLRLVYADWLDEQGGETFASQAAFVRLQVRRSRLDFLDPDRAALLEEEAKLIQKRKRDWNGRIHHQLHRRGLLGLVDSRHGLIRKWNYHRGMISRVKLTADGLAAHADFVSSLGPVEGIEVLGWRPWPKHEQESLEPLFAGVKVCVLRERVLPASGRLTFSPLRGVSLLDLRFVAFVANHARDLLAAARNGDLPPVILFRGTVLGSAPTARGYPQWGARQQVHVIDPHNKWDALRLWFADFTGELLDPIRA